MNNSKRMQGLALLAVAIAVAVNVARSKPPVAENVSLSFSRLPISSGERVVGFEFHVNAGRIAVVPSIPAGWDVHIENDPSWNAVIRASSLVGAAAVDVRFFKKFLVIEKNESLGLPFNVSGDIVVTRDFVRERRIRISMKDATLASVASK